MNEPPNPEVAVFAGALELPADQRGAYLDQACAGDAALRRQVEGLLRVHDEAGNFFDKLSSVAARSASAGEAMPGPGGTIRLPGIPSEKSGDRIGRYKLLQQIGEGGCGVVYMAEQEEPVRRKVALKVIKLGMDTKSVIARFEAERQALALMDHPNIAKVLDAGATDTGRPYFVMELVRGIKITDYCDENNLSTSARLELFIQVCQAIQHAHQKGIIHRDIKPSNILVADHDGVPVPKIIDFGIAKATTDQRLTDKTFFTAFEQFIGTPAYMSPEQARLSGLDIDTRSDIYSLGVLLYELLTAKTPFEAKRLLEAGLDEIRRIIREEEPVRPSTRLQTLDAAEQTTVAKHRQSEPPKLLGIIRGDLDWIVMKCLEKDRARRYETANGLAMDARRYLADEPVTACPPGKLYRFQKAIRRNKLVVAAVSAVVASLIIGLGASTWFLLRERQARQEAATAHLNEAKLEEKLRESVRQYAEVQTKVRQEQPGEDADVVRRRTYDALAKQLDIDPKLLQDRLPQLARELKSAPNTPPYDRANAAYFTKDYAQAERLAQLAAEEAQLATPPRKLEAVKALELAGISADARIDYANAMRHFREAVTLADRDHDPLEWATQEGHIANVLREQGNYVESVQVYQDAVGEYQRARGEADADVMALRSGLGLALIELGKYVEAEAEIRKVVKFREEKLGPENLATLQSRNDLAYAIRFEGKYAEAEKEQREVLQLRTKVLGPEHPDTLQSRDNLACALFSQGKGAEAEKEFRDVIKLRAKALGPEHPDTLHSRANLADTLGSEGQRAESEKEERAVIKLREKVLGPEHPDTILSRLSLANMLSAPSTFAEGNAEFQEVIRLGEKVLGPEHPTTIRAHWSWAWSLHNQHRYAEAETEFRESIKLIDKALGREHPASINARNGLAWALWMQDKYAEVESVRRELLDIAEKMPGPEHSVTLESRKLLAEVLLREGKLDEARSLYLEAADGTNTAAVTMQDDLGWRYQNGLGCARDFSEAVKWYRKAAEGGNAMGQVHLGWMYEMGLGVEKDYTEAVKWYRKAAEQDNSWGQMRLGWLYENGGGVQKDYAEAVKLYRQSAQQDNPQGQLDLGHMYQNGWGVEKNYTEAMKLYLAAGKSTDVYVLNELAWRLATSAAPEMRDRTNAVRFAETAVAAVNRRNPDYLDTLAAAYAEAGQFDKAVSVQQEAMNLLNSEGDKKDRGTRLKLYQSNIPYRIP